MKHNRKSELEYQLNKVGYYFGHLYRELEVLDKLIRPGEHKKIKIKPIDMAIKKLKKRLIGAKRKKIK